MSHMFFSLGDIRPKYLGRMISYEWIKVIHFFLFCQNAQSLRTIQQNILIVQKICSKIVDTLSVVDSALCMNYHT